MLTATSFWVHQNRFHRQQPNGVSHWMATAYKTQILQLFRTIFLDSKIACVGSLGEAPASASQATHISKRAPTNTL